MLNSILSLHILALLVHGYYPPCYPHTNNYNGNPLSPDDPGCSYCPINNENGWKIDTRGGKPITDVGTWQYLTNDFGDTCEVSFTGSSCVYRSGEKYCTCRYMLDNPPPTAKNWIPDKGQFPNGSAVGQLWNTDNYYWPECKCPINIAGHTTACNYVPATERCKSLKAFITDTCDLMAKIDQTLGILSSVCGGFTQTPGIIQTVGTIADNIYKLTLNDAGGPLNPGATAGQTIKAEYTLFFDVIAKQVGLEGITDIAKLVAVGTVQSILLPGFGIACKILDALGVANAVCQITAPVIRGSCKGTVVVNGKRDSDTSPFPALLETAAIPAHRVNKRSDNPCVDLQTLIPDAYCTAGAQTLPNCDIGTYEEAYDAGGYTRQQYNDFKTNCQAVVNGIIVAKNICNLKTSAAAFIPYCANSYVDPGAASISSSAGPSSSVSSMISSVSVSVSSASSSASNGPAPSQLAAAKARRARLAIGRDM